MSGHCRGPSGNTLRGLLQPPLATLAVTGLWLRLREKGLALADALAEVGEHITADETISRPAAEAHDAVHPGPRSSTGSRERP
ncbi:hypothetical protein AB0958_20225 [Streptomyces sp. NPDC006655]|uniref:hypothetical protein n=1 Tax=Streptomyces sp. NPDC006655 TaxID=3156898 RepID=UPI0034540C81